MLAGPPPGRRPKGVAKEGETMRRIVLLAAVLPFVSAFLGGLLAISFAAPRLVTAQPEVAQEVRASAFTLVYPSA